MAADVPLLFLGAFVAAATSGAAGFGGALLLLPLLAHSVGPALAVPLLTLAQLVGNASRMAFGFREIHWRSVALFLVAGLPGAVLGALCFVSIPKAVVVRLIGAAILAFALLRLSGRLRFVAGRRTLLLCGGVTGLVSGLVGSAGPLGPAVFLTLGLSPVATVASDAMASLALHAAKTAVYQHGLHMPREAWFLALVLSAGMILGTWVSKRLIEGLRPDRFRKLATTLLAGVACQLIVFG